MDNIFWGVYLADIVGTLKVSAIVLIAVSTIVLWVLVGLKCDNVNIPRWQFITSGIVLVLSVIINIFTPSKQAIYIMLGVKTTDVILDQPVAKKTIELLELKIDKELDEIKKETKDSRVYLSMFYFYRLNNHSISSTYKSCKSEILLSLNTRPPFKEINSCLKRVR